MGRAEHLAESLILGEEEGAVAAVVEMRDLDGAAEGDAKLVADEGRDAARAGRRGVVEEVARVERGIAQKLERGAVHRVGARLGEDVGEAGRATPDFGGHPPRAGADLLDRIHVEVGESRSTHFGIGAVGAVHGEHGRGAALPVDRELSGKIGRAVGVGHGAGRQQQQLAEVALVQGHGRDGFGRQLLAPGALAGCGAGAGAGEESERAIRRPFEDGRRRAARQAHRPRAGCRGAVVIHRDRVLARGQRRKRKPAVAAGGGRGFRAAGLHADDGAGDGRAVGVAQGPGPRIAGGLVRASEHGDGDGGARDQGVELGQQDIRIAQAARAHAVARRRRRCGAGCQPAAAPRGHPSIGLSRTSADAAQAD